MADTKLSATDIKNLAVKLSSMDDKFTTNEKDLLLGIFGMASTALAAAVSRTQQSHPELKITERLASKPDFAVAKTVADSHMPSLGEAFQGAFVPGKASGFALGGLSPLEDSIGVSVGGVCVSVSWSKDIKEFVQPEIEQIDIGPGI